MISVFTFLLNFHLSGYYPFPGNLFEDQGEMIYTGSSISIDTK